MKHVFILFSNIWYTLQLNQAWPQTNHGPFWTPSRPLASPVGPKNRQVWIGSFLTSFLDKLTFPHTFRYVTLGSQTLPLHFRHFVWIFFVQTQMERHGQSYIYMSNIFFLCQYEQIQLTPLSCRGDRFIHKSLIYVSHLADIPPYKMKR